MKKIWVLTYSIQYETQDTFLGAWETKPHLNTLKNFIPLRTNDEIKELKQKGRMTCKYGADYELAQYKIGTQFEDR